MNRSDASTHPKGAEIGGDVTLENRRCTQCNWWLVFIVGSLLALPFALNLAMDNSLGRDEHQHLAAGIVMAREGWLPYRDFAFFHVPYLAWTYAWLFRLGVDPLLMSRVFAALCTALMGGLVFAAGWQVWATRQAGRFRQFYAWIMAGAGLAALLTVPLFAQVSGHSWNLEPSTLFSLAAFVALLHRPGTWRLVGAGLLLGIAAGYRVTVLPMVLPLGIMAWLNGRSWRPVLLFAAGLSAGMLPLAIVFLMNPVEFFFGNVEFPKVNIDYRYGTGEPRTMTLGRKLRFFFKEVMRPNWPLLIGFPALLLVAWGWLKVRFWKNEVLAAVLLMVPFLMMGALAPSPAFDQYFYPLLPFLVVGLLAALRQLPANWQGRSVGTALALGFLGFGWFSFDEYKDPSLILKPEKWSVKEAQQVAVELRSRIAKTDTGSGTTEGRILTVAPGWALEAGFAIYPEFVTGPFAWRVTPFVAEERHERLHLLSPEKLEARLAAAPPVAILTGYAKREEELIVDYAKAHRYRKEKLSNGKTLWLPPRESTTRPLDRLSAKP